MPQLKPRDVSAVINALPAHDAITDPWLVLAGGFIRATIQDEHVNDIDLFCPSKNEARRIAGDATESQHAYNILYKPTIQIVFNFDFKSPEDLISQFDFSISQAAMWFDNRKWHSVCCDDYYKDLADMRLRVVKPRDMQDTVARAIKFHKMGYMVDEVYGRSTGQELAQMDPVKYKRAPMISSVDTEDIPF